MMDIIALDLDLDLDSDFEYVLGMWIVRLCLVGLERDPFVAHFVVGGRCMKNLVKLNLVILHQRTDHTYTYRHTQQQCYQDIQRYLFFDSCDLPI